MDRDKIEKLLVDVKEKRIEVSDAVSSLNRLPFEDLGFARPDTHRQLRTGYAEVIFCKGKKTNQIIQIFETMTKSHSFVMATKATKEIYQEFMLQDVNADFYEEASIIAAGKSSPPKKCKDILVLSAGTSDIPVAEEAAVTAELMGHRIGRSYDVGVAGIHRLLNEKEKFEKVNSIIVVAGMEGALVSIVSGMTDKPVIAVPTSVGYGSSFEGLSALLAMLNSCAPGVAVMNIDNGFGAGYFAGIME